MAEYKSRKGRETAAQQLEERPLRGVRHGRPGRSKNPIGPYGSAARSLDKGTGPVSRKLKLVKVSRSPAGGGGQ